MAATKSNASNYSSRERNAAVHLMCWPIAWGISIALASASVKFLFWGNTIAIVLAVGIQAVIGCAAIVAHIKYFNAIDEMQRKIQLESMAFAYGALFIGLGSLQILSTAGTNLPSQWNIAFLMALGALTLAIGNRIGILRKR